jgi:hypothetical protein
MNNENGGTEMLLTPEALRTQANKSDKLAPKKRTGKDALLVLKPQHHRVARSRRDLTEREKRENAIDRILLEPLEKRFADLNMDHLDALLGRCLLPPATATALCSAAVHARYLAHVKLASRLSKVPVSLLLAECWWGEDPAGINKVPNFGNERKVFETVQSVVIEHAERLASDSRLKRVLEAARSQSREQYLRELERCEFWDAKERHKRVDCILKFDLLYLDGFKDSDNKAV